MKKIYTCLLGLLLSTSTCFALPENVKTPKDLTIYLRNNIYYGTDQIIPGYFEYFQTPPILEYSRIGDCDDFAIFTHYYLELWGFNPRSFVLYYKINDEYAGHAVTTFKDADGTYSVFSNQTLIPTSYTNPIDAVVNLNNDIIVISIYLWEPDKFGFVTYDEFLRTSKLVRIVNLTEYAKFKILEMLR